MRSLLIDQVSKHQWLAGNVRPQTGDITVTARFQVQVDESLTAVNRQRHLTVSREVRDKIRSERKGYPLAGSQVYGCPCLIASFPHPIPFQV